MKKLLYKTIVIITILFLPIIINAKIYNYKDAIEKTNAYIYDFPEYNDYIKLGDMPYDYENGENKINPYFTKGGFISKDEYQITNIYGNSYLSQGIEYWTLTPHSVQKNYTLSYTLQDKLLTDETNFKVTQFVKNETKVAGDGTLNNPWYFLEVISINMYSSNESRGRLSLTGCNHISEGTKTIVVNKYGDQKAKFYICEDKDFRYYKSTCSSNLEREGTSNKMFLFGNINDNTICKMDFGYKTYTITLKNCEGCNEPGPNPVYLAHNKDNYFKDEFGENVITKINIPEKPGYTFEGYYKDNGFEENNKIINSSGEFISKDIDSNMSLEPKMKVNEYMVTFDSNGGETPNPSEKKVTYDKKYGELPTVSRIGYTFQGWYTKKTNGTKVNADTIVSISSDHTLYAIWEQNEYKVTFNLNGGDSVSPTNKKVKYDSTYGTLPTPIKTGYTFEGWYTTSNGGTKIESTTKVTITSNQTLYAHWTANTNTKYIVNHYKMTGKNDAAASTPFRSDTLYGTSDSSFTPADKKQVPTGYTYKEAQNASGSVITNETISRTGSTIVNLYYNQNYVTVKYNATDATTIKFKNEETTKDELKKKTATKIYYDNIAEDGLANLQNSNWIYLARKGYDITGNWYNGSIKYDQATKFNAKQLAEHFKLDISTSNKTLELHPEWKIINYTITYNLNGGTNPSGVKTSYTIETADYTLPSPTRTGYKFNGWYTKSDFSGSKAIKIAKGSTGNKTYYAKWELATLPLFEYTGSYQLVKDDDTIIASGTNSKVTIPASYANYTGNWKIRFLTDGEFKMLSMPGGETIDIFLVGGGGGVNATGYGYQCGGGGGGYTKTEKNKTIKLNEVYKIDIGAGGDGTTAVNVTAGTGKTTSAFGYEAKGGKGSGGGGTNVGCAKGGDGGSGGGGACNNIYHSDKQELAAGGTDGGDGIGCRANSKGKGQGTTTREFGEESGKLYAAGGGGSPGGGAWGEKNKNKGGGADNTGGGAFARLNARKIQDNPEIYETLSEDSLDGFSGIVVIRNAR